MESETTYLDISKSYLKRKRYLTTHRSSRVVKAEKPARMRGAAPGIRSVAKRDWRERQGAAPVSGRRRKLDRGRSLGPFALAGFID
jgi:hypothetical protein